MKNLLLLLVLSLMAKSSYAQSAWVTKPLSEALQNTNILLKVNIVMNSKVNIDSLQNEFHKNHTSLDNRAKTTIRLLMDKATKSQKNILVYLNNEAQNAGEVSEVKPLWICNIITAQISADVIKNLAHFDEIEHIELSAEQTVLPVNPMKGSGDVAKSVGGVEPGIQAIHSPALWAMGYTGHGRLMYSVDTGCWPTHPAIGSRFKGNFYPLSQTWCAFDLPTPGDKSHSHGTHILGTTLGLDQNTHDTIGSAFNAYWIASDPIVQDLADVKPLTEIMSAFQWAFNPDGDTSTTTDIPDAINNSWGLAITPGIDSLCHSNIMDMLNATEAVGIAAIFAAGNEGPGDTTVGRPAFLVNSLVNNFAVGALNAASPTLTIASFSSRGPSVCGGSGSLLIKPEVSAPGVNVRSSVGFNSYDFYDGTSMASPHVTGAVLLLKEAFPYLPGEEIKLALYYSAIDLGDPGEDNIYGMGIIDVEAAFNYLAQTHIPVPPAIRRYDLAVEQIVSPVSGSLSCQTSISPIITLNNAGDSTLTSAKIYYRFDNESEMLFNWEGNLIAGQTVQVTLPAIQHNTLGGSEFLIRTELTNTALTEYDLINNRRVSRITFLTTEILPFAEDFESGIDPHIWNINNPNMDKTWDTLATSGLPFSGVSAYMNFGPNIPAGEVDELISPLFFLTGNDSLSLTFDMAYKVKSTVYRDSLKVFISTDCGITFPHLIYSKCCDSLATTSGHTANFLPSLPEHWRTENISLSQFEGEDKIIIKFWAKSKMGNNLALDNIQIYNGVRPVSLPELQPIKPLLFPNPAEDLVEVSLGNSREMVKSFRLYSIDGKLVSISNTNKLNVSAIPQGLYFAEIETESQKVNVKLVIKRQ